MPLLNWCGEGGVVGIMSMFYWPLFLALIDVKKAFEVCWVVSLWDRYAWFLGASWDAGTKAVCLWLRDSFPLVPDRMHHIILWRRWASTITFSH